jgi:hypothetical protein
VKSNLFVNRAVEKQAEGCDKSRTSNFHTASNLVMQRQRDWWCNRNAIGGATATRLVVQPQRDWWCNRNAVASYSPGLPSSATLENPMAPIFCNRNAVASNSQESLSAAIFVYLGIAGCSGSNSDGPQPRCGWEDYPICQGRPPAMLPTALSGL